MNRAMLVAITKDTIVTEEDGWIICTPPNCRPKLYPKGSVVISQIDDLNSWSGQKCESITFDELQETDE